MKKLYALLFCLGLFLVSCEEDDPIVDNTPPEQEVEYTAGSANFSKYVALGNSLTAGYSDAALFRAGQEASFPVMLASNFSLVGGGEFTVPFMADDLGGATLGGQPILGNRLILDFSSGSPAPVPVEGQGATEITNTLSGPFNNMGVPGAKSYHLLAPGYGNVQGVAQGLANPYFARFASSANATVLGDAAAQGATFFSLWIGNNDVLGFATSGGAGVDQTGNLDPSTYGSADISDPNVVAGSIDAILQTMTANGADGIIANIPDVTSIPFLTTVPHNPVPLDAATADLLNNAYAAYNGGLAQLQALGAISAEEVARRTISFSAGEGNAVVIIDEDLTDLTAFNPALINMRQATEDDLLVLTSRTFIGTLANPNDPTSINGVAVPLEDKWVLTPEEQTMAQNAVVAYNQAIAGLAAQYDLAFVDANALLTTLKETGFTLPDGSVVTAEFGTGGGFSLDGVHPSPRGYAIIANAMIEVVNEKFGSNLPGVNPLDYTGLYIN
ncbi:MAG: G-D-S-L family lipolytic protein [Muricauda sp.]|nr:SGNH/GDSL hydrolase family protein [Allomuricauda sp.]MAU26608.1 G-D-S-L family lipolytic protein [Allomuricauda sp.]MBC31990.1 G-D-S-L family lipolytic protein [Allomuricauda sp.]|tara:strand:+ start:48182 stop:49681 length:1500 start_codon:yes stop_codon:yes gene_type:complete